MKKESSRVAIYDSQVGLETAVRELRSQSFEMEQLSILNIDALPEANKGPGYTFGDRLGYWTQRRDHWSGLIGNASGSGLFGIPGLGTLMIVGPATTAVARVLEEAPGHEGLRAVGVALHDLGVEEGSISESESALQARKFLLLVSGSEQQLSRSPVSDILRRREATPEPV
jgi:hypothetical protein